MTRKIADSLKNFRELRNINYTIKTTLFGDLFFIAQKTNFSLPRVVCAPI